VGHFLAGAEEAGVATIHEDGAIALRVATQGVNQLPPLGVVQGTKVHGNNSFLQNKETKGTPATRSDRLTQFMLGRPTPPAGGKPPDLCTRRCDRPPAPGRHEPDNSGLLSGVSTLA